MGQTTTIHISIPNASVGSVIGKGGVNINQIRQMSGAKIKVHESQAGAQERLLEMSGSAEQVQTAQNLVTAFMHTKDPGMQQ